MRRASTRRATRLHLTSDGVARRLAHLPVASTWPPDSTSHDVPYPPPWFRGPPFSLTEATPIRGGARWEV